MRSAVLARFASLFVTTILLVGGVLGAPSALAEDAPTFSLAEVTWFACKGDHELYWWPATPVTLGILSHDEFAAVVERECETVIDSEPGWTILVDGELITSVDDPRFNELVPTYDRAMCGRTRFLADVRGIALRDRSLLSDCTSSPGQCLGLVRMPLRPSDCVRRTRVNERIAVHSAAAGAP